MNQDRILVMQDRDFTVVDRLLLENARLRQRIESRDELLDYYIEHYTELKHEDTTRKFKQLQEDIRNGDIFLKANTK